MSDEFVHIYVNFKQFTPDPRQWKPGMPVLEPENVKVLINVPKTPEYYVGMDGQTVILTLDGMCYTIKAAENKMQQMSNIVKDDELSKYKDEDFE